MGAPQAKFSKLNKENLEIWCEELPDCERFLRSFFVAARERKEWHKTLELYMESIVEAIVLDKKSDYDGFIIGINHQELLDAYHNIFPLDYDLFGDGAVY